MNKLLILACTLVLCLCAAAAPKEAPPSMLPAATAESTESDPSCQLILSADTVEPKGIITVTVPDIFEGASSYQLTMFDPDDNEYAFADGSPEEPEVIIHLGVVRGTHKLLVRAFDAEGNRVGDSLTAYVNVEGTPQVRLTQPYVVPNAPNIVYFTTVDQADTYLVQLYDPEGNCYSVIHCGADEHSCVIEASEAQGLHTVHVYAVSRGADAPISDATGTFTVEGVPELTLLSSSRLAEGDEVQVVIPEVEGAASYMLILFQPNGISRYIDLIDASVRNVSYKIRDEQNDVPGPYALSLWPYDAEGNRLYPTLSASYHVIHNGLPAEAEDKFVLGSAHLQMADSFEAGEEITFTFQLDPDAEHATAFLSYAGAETRLGNFRLEQGLQSWTVPMSLPEGDYELTLNQYAENYYSEAETVCFSVHGTLLPAPVLMISPQRTAPNTPVTLTATQEGATDFRFVLGEGIVEVVDVPAVDGQASIERSFAEEKFVFCTVSAKIDGRWTESTLPDGVNIVDHPSLDAPVVTLPENVRAGEIFTISWTPVENATSYDLVVRSQSTDDYHNRIDARYIDGLSYTYTLCDLPQDDYTVTVAANGDLSVNNPGVSEPQTLTLLEPLYERAFVFGAYQEGRGENNAYDVSSLYIHKYLGKEVPEDLVIPETIPLDVLTERIAYWSRTNLPTAPLPIASISSGFLEGSTLKAVTLPRTIRNISDGVFAGNADLVIRGYTGTLAETFAGQHGYAFDRLDDGSGDFAITIKEPVYVNQPTTVVLEGIQNALLVDASLDYMRIIDRSEDSGRGTASTITFEDAGTHLLHFEVLQADKTYLYSAYIPVEVQSLGQMPAVEGLAISADNVERGTTVYATFTLPEGYDQFQLDLATPLSESEEWGSHYNEAANERFGMTADRQLTYGISGTTLKQEGTYTLSVAVMPEEGYERVISSATIQVTSTRPFGYYNELRKIFDYVGTESDVTIPAEVDGMPVEGISDSAFFNNNFVTVAIAPGVQTIGSSAFEGCRHLTAITLPDSITQISVNAFKDCVSLERVVLPAQMTNLFGGLFSGCTALREVVLPEGLTSLGAPDPRFASPFEGCTALEAVYLPKGITAMEQGCLPEGVTIYGYAGTVAERYATKYGHPFVALEE